MAEYMYRHCRVFHTEPLLYKNYKTFGNPWVFWWYYILFGNSVSQVRDNWISTGFFPITLKDFFGYLFRPISNSYRGGLFQLKCIASVLAAVVGSLPPAHHLLQCRQLSTGASIVVLCRPVLRSCLGPQAVLKKKSTNLGGGWGYGG